jgi:hypothetical protein
MSSNRAAALEPPSHSALFVRRAAAFLVAAFLVVLGARLFPIDAVPFLTDISPDKFGRFWPLIHRWTGRLYTLVWLSWSMPLLATEVIFQGRKIIARSDKRTRVLGTG